MTEDELKDAVLDCLAVLEKYDRDKKKFLSEWRIMRNDAAESLLKYRRKLSGEDRQLEISE